MAFVDIDGVKLETALLPGDATKPWLVFLHEGLGSVSSWRAFPEKLARSLHCRALTYSRRGYGRSDALAGPRNVRYMHDEALDVLPKLLAHYAIERPILVGHSDGASIALIYAANHAANVTGAVLMAPHVLVEAVSQQSIAGITEVYERGELRSKLARHHAHIEDAFLGWSRIWLDPRFRLWSLGAECQRLRTPALLIQGEDDAYGTLAQLDAIGEVASGPVERLVLAKCGHAPHRDQEAAVLAAIIAFAGKLTPQSPRDQT